MQLQNQTEQNRGLKMDSKTEASQLSLDMSVTVADNGQSVSSTSRLPPIGSTSGSPVDYDREAAKLWTSLGLDPSTLHDPLISSRCSSRQKHSLDPIYRHPVTNGTIFVGRRSAATSLEILTQCGVTAVVCCTEEGVNYLTYRDVKYFHFPIANWKQQCGLKSTFGLSSQDQSKNLVHSPLLKMALRE